MSTPAAIGTYLKTGPAPDQVKMHPWRGVYYHQGGDLGDLGNQILDRLLYEFRGDLDLFVEETVSKAPFGWSSFGDAYSAGNGENPASQDDVGRFAFCYVLDTHARRLDVFATHANASGERLLSVAIDPQGVPTPRFVDLDESEFGEDAHAPTLDVGPPIRLTELEDIFRRILPLQVGRYSIPFWRCREDEHGRLLVLVNVNAHDTNGELREIGEVEAYVTERDTERDRARVEAYLLAWKRALIEVLPDVTTTMATFVALGLFSPNALRRANTRQTERFFEILRSQRYLGQLRTLG